MFGLMLTVLFSCRQGYEPYKTKPKLVIGIVIDQMRYDFLYRYWNKYGNGGFKRLLRQGYSCENTHYNYVPTYTGPGHAAIYTGCTPSVNGIVGNNWFEREDSFNMYCVYDSTATAVGTDNLEAGQMSSRNLLVTTITDELRMSNNQHSKVIGIALKDRAAILPAGHCANAAYWYDGKTGKWITSDVYWDSYKGSLPGWVNKFNDKKLPEKYLSQIWNTLLPIKTYIESTGDSMDFEEPLKGEGQKYPVFPHRLPGIKGNDYELLKTTPWGNTLTKDFAIEALKNERMGQGNYTDFLAVSFSSTDYIGHQFGPNSIEIEDTYLRLDKDIEDFLNFLDTYIGKDNALIFLTADHGVVPIPAYLDRIVIPSGNFNTATSQFDYRENGKAVSKNVLEYILDQKYGDGPWVSAYMNQQIYFNRELLAARHIKLEDIENETIAEIENWAGVSKVYLLRDTWKEGSRDAATYVANGYYPKRSGDLYIQLDPGWIEGGYVGGLRKGTTHGSSSTYDTHVPLIWYGWRIPPGNTSAPVEITDIAPTLAYFLRIQEPNGCTGNPINFRR